MYTLMKKVFSLLFIFSFLFCSAQELKKNIIAKRVSSPPKIDGVLDDDAWLNTAIAKDFVMFRPESGTTEKESEKTEVRIVFDDEAIYFGAYLYDENPNTIPQQFATRDNFGTVDWFGIMLNPNNDSQNDTEFFVQATGNQADAKSNQENEDFSWSAVWQSDVKIVKDGWIVEIKIPYSALRFSNKEIQTWGVNFHRRFANSRNQYTWNFIDRTVGFIQQYAGTISGIKNINPPTRLSFSPYASVAFDSFDGDNSFDKSIGLDVKYGISESFTLDATLIPDFGQTGFDDLVLNLGPFEQQYREQRPFFTEGVELFTKGELFYTRRVGDIPINYLDEKDLNTNEKILDNPDKVNMLNAVKISGRTAGGLGIGFFNAITEETYAKIEDTISGEIRKVLTEPMTNYSVLVLDQQFNKNSFVSLVNTNVLRNGSARDANVTGLLYHLSNKKNTHNIDGGLKTSRIHENGENTNGYWIDTSIGKDAGKWQYEVGYQMADENFDINDLGFQYYNNYQNFYCSGSFRIFEPTGKFQRYSIFYFGNLDFRFSDGAYTGNHMGINFNATTLKNFSFGGNINGNIGEQYDYFEPRAEGRYFTQDPRLNFNSWISSDFSKKFAIEVSGYYGIRIEDNQKNFDIGIQPRYRFSNKFSLEYKMGLFKVENEKGYVEELSDGTIIFGNRDRKSFTNEISARLNFDTKSALALSFRHYWSPVQYEKQYYQLEDNGSLIPNPYQDNNDINYNIWNLDLSYSWEFAPGSQLIALYRNNIFNEDTESSLNFNENLKNLFDQSMGHNFSIKMIYYMDYNNVKHYFNKTS